MTTVTVMGEPKPKQRARTVTTARGTRKATYTPPETVAAEHKIGLEYRGAHRGGVLTLTEPCGVRLAFYCHRTGRGDIDNLAKLALDALNGVAYADDRQVIRLVVDVYDAVPKDEARTVIIVVPIPTKETQ